ncbi:hypothetical protein [Synechocystis sp. PCC 7509]|uniref:hypothetical protein n=1 Tax=Synechocystis sp. PCC 7509 TaxID=927677 RepID=UPI0002AD01A6|nr:hypothetical protein [Synechocystis sp. PCC 7509]
MLEKILAKFKSNDSQLWSKTEEFDASWKTRIALMASYIDVPGTVADFGCGMMWLEAYLSKDNPYLPIDYIQRDSRTIVLDLNRDSIPNLNADIAFLSGILEYIEDLDSFLQQLIECKFKKILVSYCTIENLSSIKIRKKLNWVSHESIFIILSVFCKKYTLVHIDRISNNTILIFNNKL